MKNIYVAYLLYVFLVSCPSLYACGPSLPLPGSCSIQLLNSLKQETDRRASDLAHLSADVLESDNLQLSYVKNALTWSGSKTSLDLIKDDSLRRQLEMDTPVGLAQQAEHLHSHLSDKQWHEIVVLWAAYLKAESKNFQNYNPSQVCDPLWSAGSMMIDAGYIILTPVFVLGGPAAVIESESPKAALGIVVAPVAGVLGLASDVITFVPSTIVHAANQFVGNRAAIRSSKAFEKFARVVLKYKEKSTDSH